MGAYISLMGMCGLLAVCSVGYCHEPGTCCQDVCSFADVGEPSCVPVEGSYVHFASVKAVLELPTLALAVVEASFQVGVCP